MTKKDRIQLQLDELAQLADKELDQSDIALIKKSLQHKSNLVVAKAVGLVAQHQIIDLASDVELAFAPLMEDCVKRDSQCHAKVAIVDCLSELKIAARQIYRDAMKHVQMEPVWGDHVDTACELRGKAAVALAFFGDENIVYDLVELLCDVQPNVRSQVVRALGIVGGLSCEHVLRFLLLQGEDDPETVGEACAALLSIDPERSLVFIKEHVLEGDALLASEAAYAIGESRCDGAFEALTHAFTAHIDFDEQRIFIMPLITLRRQESDDFLIDQYTQASKEIAQEIERNLELFTESLALKKRINELKRKT